MKKRRNMEIAVFIAAAIMINFLGKTIASRFNLPIWLDSVGTLIAAYACDPFCGAVVGLAGNIIYAFQDPVSLIYGLTSIAIGISAGIAARKKLFETAFGTITASVIITIFSVVISTPLNLLINEGNTGNMWGDGVGAYLLENRVPTILAATIGEFFVDFLDKVITSLILFFLIRSIRLYRKIRKKWLPGVLLLILTGILWYPQTALAQANDINNNNIQTIYSSDNGLPCGEANDVAQTNDGILWVGTYAGLYRYNGSEFRLMSEYDCVRNVNCLYVDAEGRLWIGTNDNGLSIAIHEKIVNIVDVESGLPSNSIRSITMDANGNYYVGTTSSLMVLTMDGGLGIVSQVPEVINAHSLSASPDGEVAAVTNDGRLFLLKDGEILESLELDQGQEIYTCAGFREDGMLYVGTSSNRLYLFEVAQGRLHGRGVMDCGALKNINRIYFTAEGLIYLCSDGGVGYVDQKEKYHSLNMGEFNNSIDNMTMDYQGNLWFSSSRLGLLKVAVSPFTDVYRTAGMTRSVVNAVTRWKSRLYVGTDDGLDIINLKNKQVTDELTEQLSGVRIRCLLADSQDRLWICTYGKGLYCVQKNGSIRIYDGTDQEFGNWSRVVIELSDGTIAASCDTGLGLFTDRGLQQMVLYEDGFSKAMVLSLMETSEGEVLCGTDGDGIVIVKDGKVTGRYTRKDGLSSDVILRMVSDPVGKGAYLVTSNGLCYLDSQKRISLLNQFPYYNNYDVWAFEDGRIFVLSSAGIYVTTHEELFRTQGRPEVELLDSKRGLSVALTANSWDYLDDNGELYLSCDNGVYGFNVHNYGVARKSYRMMISSIYLDGVPYELERGETFHIDRDVSKIEIFPEIVNYAADDPGISYYLEGFEQAPNIVSQSSLSSIVYTNVPSGTYRFHLCVLDNKNENVIEESVFELLKEEEIYDTGWFHAYMFIVSMMAVAWLTWFIVRTQIQRTINFQKKELEFAKNQLRMGNETILAIAKTVDAKDENTSLHSQRVSDYSVLIAKELGFSEAELENLRKAALLHDIGKIGIPDKVLNKAGKLDEQEYTTMKSHVTRGADILKDFTLVEHAIEGTLYHHERYDGKGYPQGLSGEKIPLYGRIIGVADAFDAMTANRVYRKRLDFDIVVGELKKGRGRQFDPKLIDILFGLLRDGKLDVEALYGEKIDLSILDGEGGES